MSRLDQQHRLAQQQLQALIERAMAQLVTAQTEQRDQVVLERFAVISARLVGAGQRRALRFALAYMAAQVRPVEPPDSERALTDTAVDRTSPVAAAPLLRLWHLQDLDEPEAVRRAGAYAGELASGDLQAAQRAGLDEGARVGRRKLRGWRKVLSAEPCPWCVTIASGGARYRRAETVPFHARDHCTVAPEFIGGADASST